LSYPDTREQGMLREAWFGENPADDMRDADAVARYGEQVRQQVATWLRRDDAYDGICETYYGPQAATELFERTVWHAAQHLRQIYVMLDHLGVTPDAPLTEADYKGLPLPDSIW
jgi:hypothetical protein